MRTLIPVISDTQVNSKLGLIAPDIVLQDGDGYLPSKGQRWLWQCFNDFINEVKVYKRPGDRVIAIHCGDALEDPWKHPTRQNITANRGDIVRMAFETHWPLRELCDQWIQVGGTEAHSGISGEIEAIFAREYQAQVEPETNSPLWWKAVANIDGYRIELSHAGKVGGSANTKTNQQGNQVFGVINSALVEGRPVPNMAIRGHCHSFTDTGRQYPVRFITLPSFQLRTVNAARNPDRLCDIGGMILAIEDGQLTMCEPILFPVRQTPEWAA
jgi:hypothetical protein